MATQTPSIETLKRGLSDFASAATDRPPTIRQMVHNLHEEIEAALRARRTFAQIAEHLTSQGVKVSQSSLQLYHRERRRELAGDPPPERARTSASRPALSPASAPAATSTARLNRDI